MNCPNCHQSTEDGAAFCGNCGQALQAAAPATPPPSPSALLAAAGAPAQPVAGVPAYALATPAQQRGETKALLALLFGIAGVIGAVFIALLGLGFGVAGVVMGTMSLSSRKRGLAIAGLVMSSLAILAGLATWVYAIQHDPSLHKAASQSAAAAQSSGPTVSAANLTTPCYSIGFTKQLNVSNHSGSCDMSAFNGATLGTSTDAYKIYGATSQTATTGNFAAVAKSALEKDTADNLPGFNIDTEQASQFAGSQDYIVNSSDAKQGTAVVEAAVFHQVASGNNIFILVHIVNGSRADLNTLEAQWQWK